MTDIVTVITQRLVDCHNESLESANKSGELITYTQQIEPLELLVLQFVGVSTTNKDEFIMVINKVISDITSMANKVANNYDLFMEIKPK